MNDNDDFVMTINPLEEDEEPKPEDEEVEVEEEELEIQPDFSFDFVGSDPIKPWNFKAARKNLLRGTLIDETTVDQKIEGVLKKKQEEQEQIKKKAQKQKKTEPSIEQQKQETTLDEDLNIENTVPFNGEFVFEGSRKKAPRSEDNNNILFRNLDNYTTVGSFTDLGLSRPLLKALSDLGYIKPTPIQQATIPEAIKGYDICASAATGSGKTAAFVLPLLEKLMYDEYDVPSTRALIFVPTRELAAQCHSVILNLARHVKGIRVALVSGGMSMRRQTVELQSSPDIIVATPGRLVDHMLNTKSFGVEDVEVLILDEADRLLQLGFKEPIEEVLKVLPKERQTLLFSATINPKVAELARLSLRNPVRISVDPLNQVAKNITQEFVRLKDDTERPGALLALCSQTFTNRVLVFFKLKSDVHRMKIVMGLYGLNVGELHGSLSQAERLDSLEKFRDGGTNILLASDVASRGLDIIGVETVINYNLPKKLTDYVHRVGRTARAGLSGRSISFCLPKDKNFLKQLLSCSPEKLKERIISPETIEKYKAHVKDLESNLMEVFEIEAIEKSLKKAEILAIAAENRIKYADDIKARPIRQWFLSEGEKQEIREERRTLALDEEELEARTKQRAKEKQEQEEKLRKSQKKKEKSLTRKQRREKMFAPVTPAESNLMQKRAKIKNRKSKGDRMRSKGTGNKTESRLQPTEKRGIKRKREEPKGPKQGLSVVKIKNKQQNRQFKKRKLNKQAKKNNNKTHRKSKK
eukprot:TRINITY_DN2378_c0_g1_i2.p1 TRINITY_DN2378_c0_g1~~TRINITY_DN2378_c0_g1_i2.p1  ORF type:complete len:754 (-),score=212.61 TRINITY_DN2378_c0_g1_i2:6-2267(-)